MGRPIIDLTNKTFGRLTVIKAAPRRERQPHKVRWVALCNCGESTTITSWQLTSGHTRSCGCLKHESRKNWNQKKKASLS